MTQFFTTPIDKSLSTTGSWQDIDLSGDIPSGATGAIFQIINEGSAPYNFGLRKNGSTDDRHQDIEDDYHLFGFVGVDANRKCQGYIENTNVKFKLVGYTYSDADFFTNAYDKSLSTTGSWQDITCSEVPDGAVAAIFEVVNSSSTTDYEFGLRKKGSTDDRHLDLVGNRHVFFIIGLDSSKTCQGYIQDTAIDFYLIGYLTSGQAQTNGIDRSLSTTGSYVEIDESSDAPSSATGIFGELHLSSSGYDTAFRKKGASYDYYYRTYHKLGFAVGLDTNKKWESKIQSTIIDFYVLGYFVSDATTETKTSTVDALLQQTVTKTFIADGIYAGTKTFAVDAVLQQTAITKTFTADAKIVNRKTKPFTANALLKKTTTKTTIADALLQQTAITKTITADGQIVNRKTKQFAADAILKQTTTKTFTADALIVSPTQFFTTPIDKSLSTTGSWQDIDLSGDIPSSATGAIFQIINEGVAVYNFGLRKNGSTDDRHQDISDDSHLFGFVGVDANRKCQGYIENTNVKFKLVGYTGTDADFFTNAYDKSLSTTGSWQDITCSEVPDGAVAAIFEVVNSASATAHEFGLRKKGSTDDRHLFLRENRHIFFIIGLDSSKTCQGYIQDTAIDFYLIGYLTSGQAQTNGIDRSLSTTGSYVEIDESSDAPSSATGIFGELHLSSSGYKTAFRKKGASYDYYYRTYHKLGFAVGLDTNKKWESKIEDTSVDFYILGYFAYSGTKTKIFTADALLQQTAITKTITADGQIVNRKTKTFWADGIYAGTKTFAVDAVLQQKSAKTFTADALLVEYAPERGFYYAKLGSYNLINPPSESFSITEELNNIASFEFVVQNNETNREIITNHLTEDFKIMRDDGTELLTGSIDSDGIEYFSESEGGIGKRIRLRGYASFIDLAYQIFKRMADDDAENVDSVLDEDHSASAFTDYTTQANNDTTNDVILTFGDVDDALYIGKDETFFSVKIKYSTKGVQAANTSVVIEYSKGSGAWATLDCIDESNAFTESAGTYLLFIPNKADDWAKNSVNATSKYWIRFRITQGSYTTAPKLDRIWLSNTDVCRVQFVDTSAKTILSYVLDGTGYSEDATDQCPTTQITIRGEYESRLRWIAGIARALSWTDADGDVHSYDWWIDTSKKVHFKQQRGTARGDISANFTMLTNRMNYQQLATRVYGFGSYEGINQKRAIVEDTDAQNTYGLRELVFPDLKITNYQPLKEEMQKVLADHKTPLPEISCTVDTKYCLDLGLKVGDTVTINQPVWNISNQQYRVMRMELGPSRTQIDLGISQTHLEHIQSNLQRQMEINNVWMHGSVTTFISGPVEENYERVDADTVYPVILKIDLPDNTRAINRVELSWTLHPYKSSVNGSEGGGGHYHSIGFSGWEGGHFHTIGDSGYEGAHWHIADTDYAGGHIHTIDEGGGTKTSGQADSSETIIVITNVMSKGWIPSLTECLKPMDDYLEGCGYAYFITELDWQKVVTPETHKHSTNINHDHSESTEPDHYHEGETDDAPDHVHSIPNSATEPDHQHSNPDTATEPDHEHPLSYGIHEESGGTTLEVYVNDVLVGNNYVGDQSKINITGWIQKGTNTVKLQPIVGDNAKGRAHIYSVNTIFIENRK